MHHRSYEIPELPLPLAAACIGRIHLAPLFASRHPLSSSRATEDPGGIQQTQSLEAEWATVQESLQDADILSVDCATEAAFCSEMDAVTFPAIRVYNEDGTITRYRGPRRSKSILAFYRRVSRPVVSEITDPAISLHDFTTSDDITFTAEFLPKGASLYEWQYRNLARQYHDRYSFAILPPSQQQSAIRCRNNINDENFTLKELWLVGALDELVSQCTAPLILELTRKDIAELGQLTQRTGKHLAVHYFTESHDGKEIYHEEMLGLAKKYSKEVLFTIVDTNEHPLMSSAAGLGSGSGISIENLRTGDLFPYERAKISAADLEAFLLDIVQGNILPWDGSRANVAHDEL
ncbi:hypothetical protein B0T16DRAFT_513272 [Cercophora newfieldiana]|uniref:Thioredoxin domain-containing protein n=1 Tax=Cercophora newfieldiana TaxID=92897 RepID=A0AA39Y2K5_9PEZI|nr:hypothetical protein B0T16DRAFT_513272 [Cercophora newfieldiana]